MPDPQDAAYDKQSEELDGPEVVAHDAEDDPWCVSYTCGSLAPN